MDSSDKLHLLFFPLMSPGHFIPMVDMARLFSSFPNVHCSFITTPANPITISAVNVITIPFPDPSITGLAVGQENLSTVPTSGFTTFTTALFHFRDPITTLLHDLRPDALISDSLFPWTAAVARDLHIPRIIFHGAGAFPLYVSSKVLSQFPIQTPSFSIAGQPHEIHLHKDGLPELFSNFDMLRQLGEAEFTSYGVVINTFYEMEPSYVDYYKINTKAWCVGPLSEFGREGRVEEDHEVLSWLDNQPEGSVIYVCFGSLCHFTAAELREIAVGLEKSGERFVWVVRKEFEEDEVKEEWLPEGFEKRVEGRGMMIRGWVPQVKVLRRAAVGWFVTHCGWNSLQEGVVAGVGLVTWPLFHEQFVNQELAVEVMGVGVRMWDGFRRRRGEEVVVTAEEIAGVVKKVMGGGEEVEKVKRKAKEYGEKGRKAVEESGSTFEDVRRLVEDLEARRRERMVAGG
ncbi:scopoletin glucosyltransferase-like [Dioscorea cayenensis subsp. rotundata]|uniref:Scopoletin glucosyltransferase-like n=1 Tax=Dioscorea cayennensis subsp. rotundata TaxID=55577 RepID=A0AB40B033_DIOCR|nr:scopoletin glucosyltransferase-like [Dioscorea cayenensis subsp. rotundata]